jgi:hypothetical protein
MRNMSFWLTTKQCRDKTKDVTRRLGWSELKAGDLVQQVVKGQGLKKGEAIEKIHVIRIISTRWEPLKRLTDDLAYGFAETAREGFPEGSGSYSWPSAFVGFFCNTHHCTPEMKVNRIEFEYVREEK